VESRDVYRVLVGKPEGKRPLGRPGRRCEDNIKVGLQKWDVRYRMDRSGSRYGQVAGICKCANEPSGFIKCGEFLD
jgi:hypothetical protein